MPIIKRYPNRKLYDTKAKQYVTLEGIAALIRQGYSVQVIDNVSGEDITALTLSQVILEQEKKPGGFLPISVLADLIQAGTQHFPRSRPGSASITRYVDQAINQRLVQLVQDDELTTEVAQELACKLLSSKPHPDPLDPLIERVVERLMRAGGIPRQAQIDDLHTQIDHLSQKINALHPDIPLDDPK